jgi:predicted amidohydrolase YtcJ
MNTDADTVFTNGSVVTVDVGDQICEAVAVAGNRITFVGGSKDVEQFIGPKTEVIDLAGRSLLPGIIDAHCHPGSHGATKLYVQCGPDAIGSIEDLKRQVASRVKSTASEAWIVGRGYDHTELAEKRHPTRWDLDEVAPDHKVCVSRKCGHVLVVNSRALEEVGYGPDTPDPEGGKIERNPDGQLTGVLYESARVPFWKATFPSMSELESSTPLMNADFLKFGITSAHDASGRNPNEIRVYQKGVAEGWLKVRLYLMVRLSGDITIGNTYLESGLITGFGNEKLRLGALKLMIDGSVGGRTAAVNEAYPGDSNNYGITYMSQEELDTQVLKGHRAGYQVGIHAIGDKAVEMTLSAFEKAQKLHPRGNHRHRIEHCGLLNDQSMDRIRDLNLVPALGTPFIYELGDNYFDSLGKDRLGCMYPLKSLMNRGIIAPLSSDTPVIHPNPMHGIYSAITRKTKSGQIISPGEDVTVKEAIRAYTLYGAYASFEEDIKGSIEVGKLADLVVLSQNILETPPEEILGIAVDMTMVDGEMVYRKTS